jgi:type IV secretion system protein VirD4
LARGFIPDPGPAHPESRYYAQAAGDILSSVFLYVVACEADQTMGGCLAFMTSNEPMAARLRRMMASTHPAVQATAQQLLHLDERSRQPLWSAAVGGLSLWRNPVICARTQHNTIDLGAFQLDEQPISLFLRSPESQLEHLAPLMRTIVQVVIGRCMERAIDRSRRKLLFLLDEFSSMGPCLPIVTALPRMAGYGLRACLITQDLSDITRLYGRDNNIVQNCSSRCFMTPNDVSTARYVSLLLGIETVETLSERTGTSTSGLSGSVQDGESIGQAARGLMTLDEVLRLPESNVLVFLSGQPPLLADKIPYDDGAYSQARSMKGA